MLELNKLSINTQDIETIYNSDEEFFELLYYGSEYDYCVFYHAEDEESGELVFAAGDEEEDRYPWYEDPYFIMTYTVDTSNLNWLGDLIAVALEFLEKCDKYLEKNGAPEEYPVYFE